MMYLEGVCGRRRKRKEWQNPNFQMWCRLSVFVPCCGPLSLHGCSVATFQASRWLHRSSSPFSPGTLIDNSLYFSHCVLTIQDKNASYFLKCFVVKLKLKALFATVCLSRHIVWYLDAGIAPWSQLQQIGAAREVDNVNSVGKGEHYQMEWRSFNSNSS